MLDLLFNMSNIRNNNYIGYVGDVKQQVQHQHFGFVGYIVQQIILHHGDHCAIFGQLSGKV